MALRAGVAVADIEFVQFHPTALTPGAATILRSCWPALLRDAKGERFVDELLRAAGVTRDDRRDAEQTSTILAQRHGLDRFDERFPTMRPVRAVRLTPPPTGCRSPAALPAAGSCSTSTVQRRYRVWGRGRGRLHPSTERTARVELAARGWCSDHA
jgi:hypothetical protein